MQDDRRYFRRLHYRWAQIEADRCGVNIGSPSRPLPKPNRILRLDPCREYCHWPKASSESPFEQARFSACADVYKTIDYNTFCKNGTLKLTEVELFFLSSKMTKKSSGEWLVVYLGLGSGVRFRYLRDEFFPDLAVVGFDPGNGYYPEETEDYKTNAKLWNDDGTNFTFYVRCLDFENDVAMIREKCGDRKLLLISDIRGLARVNIGENLTKFDKAHDQEEQWEAIKALRPVSSIVKFTIPDPWTQFFEYVPGVMLLQVFSFYGTMELRLMIDGVPENTVRYNGWEMWEKMMHHHEHLRGQVYETTRRPGCIQCFDSCFDCTVLWDTVASYAEQNDADPHELLAVIIKNQVYTPPSEWWLYDKATYVDWGRSPRWRGLAVAFGQAGGTLSGG